MFIHFPCPPSKLHANQKQCGAKPAIPKSKSSHNQPKYRKLHQIANHFCPRWRELSSTQCWIVAYHPSSLATCQPVVARRRCLGSAWTIRTAFWIDNARNVATRFFCLSFWTWSSLAFRQDVCQSNAQRKFETPNDDKDKQGSLPSNDKIAGIVLCTIQTSTSEYPANGAKRAHQTCIMNERMQPTLKREISLTTGSGLSPDLSTALKKLSVITIPI